MIFYDTSVLIAAAMDEHPMHRESSAILWNLGSGEERATAAHCLTEFYSVVTRLPVASRLSVDTALAMVEVMQARMEVVILSAMEQMEIIRRVAAAELRGGILYDALIVECARKAQAELIYTWNVRHFRTVAPDLAARIVEPG